MTIKQIAEAFSRNQFEVTYPFMAEEIRWTMVGAEHIMGRKNVLITCGQFAAYFRAVDTVFTKFHTLESEGLIRIDSIAIYTDQQGEVSRVASCDTYRFGQGLLTEITSHCIELD